MTAVLPVGVSSRAVESEDGDQALARQPGKTPRDAAPNAGIVPPFSCGSAGCGACGLRIAAQQDHLRLTGRCRSQLP